MNQIRLHKLVTQYVNREKLEYTNPEIQRNIAQFGVKIMDQLEFKRLQWVPVSESINLDHWPRRLGGNFSEVRILKLTPNFLLLFKPFGVVVQPGAGHKLDNLETWINSPANFKTLVQLSNLKPDQLVDASNHWLPVHRLDKDTQGLILFANGETNKDFFQQQFRTRTVIKEYLCVVDNYVDNLFIIEGQQTRDSVNPIKQRFYPSATTMEINNSTQQSSTLEMQLQSQSLEKPNSRLKPKYSKSKIWPIFYCPETNQTLLKVQIHTGRMHQIRLHCEFLGFPLTEDKVYYQTHGQSNSTGRFSGHFAKRKLTPKSINPAQLSKIRSLVFKDSDYCLLANHLVFKDLQNQVIDWELFSESDLPRLLNLADNEDKKL